MRWEPAQHMGERKEIKDVKEANKGVYYKRSFLKSTYIYKILKIFFGERKLDLQISIYRERILELEYAQKNLWKTKLQNVFSGC